MTRPASYTRRACPLRDEWRAWPADKRSDRLFMTCPGCRTYGSHVGEAAPKVKVAR